jgi:hypothetical protein
MKLAPIKREDMLHAADELDRSGETPWTEYWLTIPERDKDYPFKFLVRKAYEYATGTAIGPDYFQSNDGYRHYISEKFDYPIAYRVRDNIPFFTEADIEYFGRHAGVPYRKNNAAAVKIGDHLKKTIFSKTNTWARALNLEGFEVKMDNSWQRSGNFASWTWARIYRKTDSNKKVFFTVGVDAEEEALVYKLHCYYKSRNPDNALTDDQQKIFDRIVNNTDAKWKEIPATELAEYNWESLTTLTRNFIEHYLPLYDEVIRAIWSPQTADAPLLDGLRQTPPPKGIGTAPDRKKVEFSDNADYDQENAYRKEIGDKGEDLVLCYEQSLLNAENRPDLAAKVVKALDWNGYDILSYYPDERPKLVEVKTTVGPKDRSFFWTANEHDTMLENPDNYCLYRLFNYDADSHSADFYILEGDLSEKVLLRPTQYNVFVK